MNNSTMNSYEMKRDILNFSKKVSEGVNKSISKFVMDMEYRLVKSGSRLISEIARSLDENIKQNYTIERLCDNLSNTYDEEKEYTVVFVYGLSEEHPMKLLTNIKNEEKEDVIKIVRLYLENRRTL